MSTYKIKNGDKLELADGTLIEVKSTDNYYGDTPIHKIVDGNHIELADGTKIEFYHKQKHHEVVCADCLKLNNTSFIYDKRLCYDNLKIDIAWGSGIYINDYKVTLINKQWGFTNSDIEIKITNDHRRKSSKYVINCSDIEVLDDGNMELVIYTIFFILAVLISCLLAILIRR